jgi:hypothetical protein
MVVKKNLARKISRRQALLASSTVAVPFRCYRLPRQTFLWGDQGKSFELVVAPTIQPSISSLREKISRRMKMVRVLIW